MNREGYLSAAYLGVTIAALLCGFIYKDIVLLLTSIALGILLCAFLLFCAVLSLINIESRLE